MDNGNGAVMTTTAPLARYDWLEEQDSPEVLSWAKAQDELTRAYLSALPSHAPVRERLRELLSLPKRSAPRRRGGVAVDWRQEPGDELPSLWIGDGSGERCIIEAASLGSDDVAISSAELSPDGSILAWSTATGGGDWVTVRFRDSRTGEDLPDVLTEIKWTQFAWLGTDAMAYMALGRPSAGEELLAANTGASIKIHRFGQKQEHDRVVFQPADTDVIWVLPHASRDGHWLVVEEQVGIVPARLHIRPVDSDEPWQTVVDGIGPIHLLGMIGEELVCLDFRETSNGRVVAIDRRDGQERVVLAESDTAIDRYGSELGLDCVVTLRHAEGSGAVTVSPLMGGNGWTIPVPHNATVRDLSVAEDEPIVHLEITRCDSNPGSTILRHRLDTRATEVIHETPVPGSGDIAIETVHVTSADGTRVPMRIIRRAGPPPQRTAKVFLSVYGGYTIPFLTTGYATWHRAWLDAGGVLAYAGIRGGGELGERWHLAAVKTEKQRGIDDLIACVEWFEKEGWSLPRSVALNGMSNGGLMVGTVLTQRPDLLGAAIPEVGVFDMLRFHLYTAGHGWVREFGDAANPAEAATLRSYSPLHRVTRSTEYPPTLVLTADRDDRVPPGPHSYRFFAALQDAQSGSAKILLRVAHNAGHAAGRTLAEQIDERSAVLAFAAHTLKLPIPGELDTPTSIKDPA